MSCITSLWSKIHYTIFIYIFSSNRSSSQVKKVINPKIKVAFTEPKGRYRSKAVRDVKASDIGKLVSVKGIVTRATEVKESTGFIESLYRNLISHSIE